MVKNYFRIRQFSLINDYFCYVDLPDYYADDLFAKHGVKVVYGDEWARIGYKYRFIFCRVRKWNTHKFLAALGELPALMALDGHGDYEDFCKKNVTQSA